VLIYLVYAINIFFLATGGDGTLPVVYQSPSLGVSLSYKYNLSVTSRISKFTVNSDNSMLLCIDMLGFSTLFDLAMVGKKKQTEYIFLFFCINIILLLTIISMYFHLLIQVVILK
jgi:hypothetical protein